MDGSSCAVVTPNSILTGCCCCCCSGGGVGGGGGGGGSGRGNNALSLFHWHFLNCFVVIIDCCRIIRGQWEKNTAGSTSQQGCGFKMTTKIGFKHRASQRHWVISVFRVNFTFSVLLTNDLTWTKHDWLGLWLAHVKKCANVTIFQHVLKQFFTKISASLRCLTSLILRTTFLLSSFWYPQDICCMWHVTMVTSLTS